MDDYSICRLAKEYFENLFNASDGYCDPVLNVVQTRITNDDNEALLAPFSIDEFKAAIVQMHPDKSSGPDGFNPAFYQKFWPLIGKDIFQACSQWMTQ